MHINKTKVVKDQHKSEIQNILETSGDESEGEEDTEQNIVWSQHEQEQAEQVNINGDDKKKLKYKNPLMNRLEDMMNQQKEDAESDSDEPLPRSQNQIKAEELSDQLDDIINRPEIEIPKVTLKREVAKTLTPMSTDNDSSDYKQQLSERTLKPDQISEDERSATKSTKPPIPRQPAKKKKKIRKQREVEYEPDVIDYSHLYSSFYDVFNSFIQHPKTFDPSSTLRELRNLYSTYISLMDSNILFAVPQFKFEAPPLEK
jgi:hypothetical protein